MTIPPSTHGNPWRALLSPRFEGTQAPHLVFPDDVATGASLWAGANAWASALRTAGLVRGDRLVCALPASPAFVHLLLACLLEGFTCAPVAPHAAAGTEGDTLLRQIDARYLVVAHDMATDSAHTVCLTDSRSHPPQRLPVPRRTTHAPTTAAALLLQTSGTSGTPRWIGLSNRNLLATLDSHRAHLALHDACVLSVVPWHHAFGLILGLIAGLRDAAVIVRDTRSGRDLDFSMMLAAEHPITHVDLVPLLAERWMADPRGAALLRCVQGGLVGGAPIGAALAPLLATTRLRVGYGQTEAAPGIMLGAPGVFRDGGIGEPVGCAVRREPNGELSFRGDNACDGEWRDGAYLPLPEHRWHRTGDLVEDLGPAGWRYVGRVSASFKLNNGRMVSAAVLEARIRAECPEVTQSLVFTPDGHRIDVVLTTRDGAPPDPARLSRAFEGLAERLGEQHYIAEGQWPRTPKGDVDRQSVIEQRAGRRPSP